MNARLHQCPACGFTQSINEFPVVPAPEKGGACADCGRAFGTNGPKRDGLCYLCVAKVTA